MILLEVGVMKNQKRSQISTRKIFKKSIIAIYFIIFIISIIFLFIGLFGNIQGSYIFIILTFCLLLPLFIVINIPEAQETRHRTFQKGNEKIDPEISFLKNEPIVGLHERIDIISWCIICHFPIYKNEEVLACPICHSTAHKSDLLEWVKIKGSCPNCGVPLKQLDFYYQPSLSSI